MAKRRNVQYHEEPPDGGWGWFVVLATFLCHVFILGTFKSFGVFFPYWQEAFDQDAASTAWVSSIMGSVTLFGSLPAGALCNMFGCRAVVMTGSLLATTGLLSSMAVTSLAVMNLTAGFITGYLYDVTGSYNVSFYVAGGSVLFSSLMTSALEFHRTRNVQRQNLDMPGSEDTIRKTLSNDTDEKMDHDDSKAFLIVHETSV